MTLVDVSNLEIVYKSSNPGGCLQVHQTKLLFTSPSEQVTSTFFSKSDDKFEVLSNKTIIYKSTLHLLTSPLSTAIMYKYYKSRLFTYNLDQVIAYNFLRADN